VREAFQTAWAVAAAIGVLAALVALGMTPRSATAARAPLVAEPAA
jgi:hypothetical protein